MLIFNQKEEIPEFTFQLSRIILSTKVKSTYNIMNKMQDERETETKFSTWREKNSNPLHLKIDFSDKQTYKLKNICFH